MPKKQRKQCSENLYSEHPVKRWCRKFFATDEARMELPESKSEMALISTRIMCGVLFGLLFIAIGRYGHQPATEWLGWIGMGLIIAWAIAVGMGSTWEREYHRNKRAADLADYNAAIKAGNKVFKDSVNHSADDREATHKLMRNLQKLSDSDHKKFEEAMRKEIFTDNTDS